MTQTKRIAYGFKRSDRDFANLEIADNRIFIDNDRTDREELRAAIAAVEPGVTVVVVKIGDFGPGAKARQIVNLIAEKGGKVEGPKDRDQGPVAETRGRKAGYSFTPDQDKWAGALWTDPMLNKARVLERIRAETGQDVDRDQMNYRYLRKPKLKR